MSDLTRKDWSLIQTALENFSKAEQFTAGDAPMVQKARQRIAEVLGKVNAMVKRPLAVQTAPVSPHRRLILAMLSRMDDDEAEATAIALVSWTGSNDADRVRKSLKLAPKVGEE